MTAWRLAAALILVAGLPLQAAELDPHRVFTTLCSSCHTVGGGDAVGPDLAGVTERRDREWLLRFMRSPGEAIAAGDPVARTLAERFSGRVMPDQPYSRAELGGLLDYIAAGGPAAMRQQEPSPAREADVGRLLFHGVRAFEKGGAACSSCHSLSVEGPTSTLGGSLHDADRRYGAKELANVLRYPTTPLMRSLYQGHALTPEEAACVAAYLIARDRAGSEPRPQGIAVASIPWVGLLTGLVLGLFGDLAILARRWRR